MQQARYDLAVTVVGDRIYAIGGRNSEFEAVGTVEMYDPVVNCWTYLVPLQQVRYNLGVAVVNGKIYAIGGEISTSESAKSYTATTSYVVNTVEMYDPDTNCWIYKTPMPVSRSACKAPLSASSDNFVVVVLEDKIYCLSTKFTLVYDSVLDVWESKSTVPIVVDWMWANVVNGKIICLVVLNTGSSCSTVVYDPLTDTWTRRASLPAGFVAVPTVYGDELYVIGAQTEPKYDGFNVIGKVTPMVKVYDSENDVWSVVATGGPGLYYRLFSMHISGVFAPLGIYCLYTPYSHFFGYYEAMMYDLESGSWMVVAGLPSERWDVSVVVVDDLVYVLGGYTVHYEDRFGYPPDRVTTVSALVECYVPFGYERGVPEICVWSLEEGGVYDFGDVRLELGLSHPVIWVGYSLNGAANVTVEGNVTLSGLSNGRYSVVVFAEDKYGNMGASETITFTVVNAPLSVFFIVGVIVGVVVFGVVVCCGLFLFLRKRRFSKSLQADTVDGAQR